MFMTGPAGLLHNDKQSEMGVCAKKTPCHAKCGKGSLTISNWQTSDVLRKDWEVSPGSTAAR